MMRKVAWVPALVGLALVGCGGAEGRPPVTPADPAPSSEPAGDPPAAKAGSLDGPAASSTSGDVNRGVAAMKAGDLAGARAAFEAAVGRNPKQADAHFYLGFVMDKAGDRAAAEKHYKAALELQPDLHEAAGNLTALYVEAEKYSEAVAVAKRSLDKHAKNAELLLNYGIALGRSGDQTAAARAFDDAVKLAPNDARFYLVYAQELAAWKQRDQAVEKLKQAARVAGDDPAMVGSIGFELRTLRAVPECLSAFDRAIALKDNADFRTNRALCKLAAKDKAGAVSDLEAAVKNEPDFPVAHYWLAWAHHEDGKYAEAIKEYEAYLKLAPSGPMAKAADAKIKLARAKKKK